MKVTHTILLGALLALAGTACDDGKNASMDDPTTKPVTPTDNNPDETTAPDSGVAEQEFLLTDWVHALVEERSADDSDPDTVGDKKIIDTDDPAAFDTYL